MSNRGRRIRVKMSGGGKVVISRNDDNGRGTATLTIIQKSGASASLCVTTDDMDLIAEALDDSSEAIVKEQQEHD